MRSLLSTAIILVLGLGLMSLSASATIHTVSNTAQLLSVTPQLQAGDTVLLAPGVYTLTSQQTWHLQNLKGSPNAWITFRSSRHARARIVGQTDLNKKIVEISNCYFLRFEDLEITTTNQHAGVDIVWFPIGTQSADITFDRCYIHNASRDCIGSQATRLDRFTILNSELAFAENGIYLGYSSPLRLALFSVIRNCYIHHIGNGQLGYGIQIKGGSYGALIENNVLHDVGGTTRAAIAVYYADANGNQPGSRWNRIRDNVIWNGRNEGIYAVNSCVIENNVLFDISKGIVINSNGGKVVDNLFLRNNTVFRCTNYGFYLLDGNHYPGTCEVINNASLMENPQVWAFRAPSGLGQARVAGNAHYGALYGFPAQIQAKPPAQEFFAAPPGSGPGTIDLYPVAGSTLVDNRNANTALAARTDANGTPRPFNLVPDIGAYEWIQVLNPGWAVNSTFKPSLEPLTPPYQNTSFGQGARADFQYKSKAPAGSVVYLMLSAAGPSSGPPLPLIPDPFTQLLINPHFGPVLQNYVSMVPPGGMVAMQLRLPPVTVNQSLNLYHAAVVLSGQGAILETSNFVRLRIDP